MSTQEVNSSTQNESSNIVEMKTEEEEVDLGSLQKGLAKAMVLQWKSDHPDENLDDVILSITKSSGSYNNALLEKGVDKTLYDQWRYVKYKQAVPAVSRPKKPIEINLPERRERQLAQKLLNEARENKKTEQSERIHSVNESRVVDKILENTESQTTNEPRVAEVNERASSKLISSPVSDNPDVVNGNNTNEIKHKQETTGKSATQNQPEDAKDSLARIKRLLEQNKRTEVPIEISSISSDASSFIKDLQNFTSTVPKPLSKFSSNISTENCEEKISNQTVENSDVTKSVELKDSKQVENLNASPTPFHETPQNLGNLKINRSTKTANEIPKVPEVKKLEMSEVTKDEKDEMKRETPQGSKINLDRWQNQPSDSNQKKKRLIVVVDDEEKEDENILEINREISQPSKISDNLIEKGSTKQIMSQLLSSTGEGSVEVTSDQDKVEIEKGYTKQMLDKWKSQDVAGSTTSIKKRIEIRDEDGSVAENEPLERSDVVKCGSTETPNVEKGLAKQLLNQWSNIPDYKVQSSKAPIVISDKDGFVAENEPIQRDDVEREDSVDDPLQFVQKGSTKSLLEKWKNQNEVEFKTESKKIIIKEEDGHCVESEPVARTDVVRAVDVPEEEQVGKGFTSLMLNKWQQSSNTSSPKSKTLVVIDDKDGVMVENEPEIKPDLARECDNVDHLSTVQQGITKNLLGKWNNLQTGTYKKEIKPIVISEADGHVSENQPLERRDVVKAEEVTEHAPVKQGITKSLVSQWGNMKTDATEISKTPIKINEDDGFVAESEPNTRTDVLKEDDILITTDVVKKGTTKALLTQWTTQNADEPSKKEIVISGSDGHVSENQPSMRDDVVRESDNQSEKGVVSRGATQSLLKQWTEKGSETYVPSRKGITINEHEGCVAENEPVARDNVIRAEEPSPTTDTIKKGWTKSLTSQWNTGSLPSITRNDSVDKKVVIHEDEGCIAENDPTPKRDDVVREDQQLEEQLPMKGQANMIKRQLISRKFDIKASKEPIRLFENSENEKMVAENEPVKRDDVAREEDFTEEVIHKKGFAKNMVGFWNKPQTNETKKQTVIELAKGPTIFENEPAPSLLQHIKQASESGVFENQPVTRQDVVREADCEPEIISANMTRNVRKLWFQKEAQVAQKPKTHEPVRFTPPREKTPPPKEEFKSTHTLTLKSSNIA